MKQIVVSDKINLKYFVFIIINEPPGALIASNLGMYLFL